MARGSMFWSTSRGKVGDVVQSIVKGQTVTRKYQPKVNNPKTYNQVYQRVKFAEAVKMYKDAALNNWQFIYEDQLQRESSYNAFMRHNVDNALPIAKATHDYSQGAAFGALEGCCLSYGSLVPPKDFEIMKAPAGVAAVGVGFEAWPSGTEKPGAHEWGAISKMLIDLYDWRDGDLITCVGISNLGEGTERFIDGLLIAGDTLPHYAEEYGRPIWSFVQAKIDVNGTDPGNFVFDSDSNKVYAIMPKDYWPQIEDSDQYAFAFIISRTDTASGKRLVSTSYINMYNPYRSILQANMSQIMATYPHAAKKLLTDF